MTSIAAEAAAERVAGKQLARPGDLGAAFAAAAAAGVVVYKLLRSGGGDETAS